MSPAINTRKSYAETPEIGGRIKVLRGVYTPGRSAVGSVDHAILFCDNLIHIVHIAKGRVAHGPEVEVVEECRSHEGVL